MERNDKTVNDETSNNQTDVATSSQTDEITNPQAEGTSKPQADGVYSFDVPGCKRGLMSDQPGDVPIKIPSIDQTQAGGLKKGPGFQQTRQYRRGGGIRHKSLLDTPQEETQIDQAATAPKRGLRVGHPGKNLRSHNFFETSQMVRIPTTIFYGKHRGRQVEKLHTPCVPLPDLPFFKTATSDILQILADKKQEMTLAKHEAKSFLGACLRRVGERDLPTSSSADVSQNLKEADKEMDEAKKSEEEEEDKKEK